MYILKVYWNDSLREQQDFDDYNEALAYGLLLECLYNISHITINDETIEV